MNILLVTVNYFPDTAGSANTDTSRAEYLASQGHHVTVLAGFPYYPEWRIREGYRGRLWMHEQIEGVDVRRRLQYPRAGGSVLGRLLLDASFVAHGLTALTFRKPDLVLASIPPLSAAVVGGILAARFRAPMGLFVQDLVAESARQGGLPGAHSVARAVELVEGFAARGASRVAIIAEGFREPLLRMGVRNEALDLVQNFTSVAEPSLSREEVRTRLGLPQDALLCIHSGNMGYKQGLEVVLDAAEVARAQHLDRLLFLFVGNGATRAALEARAANAGLANVRFMDFVDREIFPSMLGAADVLLLTQRSSVRNMSLPSKTSSYLASGRPIVASVSADSEIALDLREADAAEFAAPGDGSDLLTAILRLEADPQRAAAIAERGQQYARERYPRERLGAALDQFILKCMRR